MQLMLLRLLLLVVTELLEGFKRLIEKRATTYRDDRFLNNNGVPLFLPVSVFINLQIVQKIQKTFQEIQTRSNRLSFTWLVKL
jgi:hypothetical protein